MKIKLIFLMITLMTTYETPILENNKKLEEQIKLLQEQIKPIENPIVKKILPFLPYEVNKIILDNLEVMKKVYFYKKKTKTLIQKFLYNRLPYYYKPFKLPNGKKEYKSEMDYEIRKKTPLNHFYYGRWDDFNDIFYHIGYDKIRSIEFGVDSQALKLVRKACNEMENKYWFFREELIEGMCENLSNIEKYNLQNRDWSDFNKLEFVVNNGLNEKKFKILKSNKSLNSKEYNKFLEFVSEYVLRKLNEIEEKLLDKFEL